MRYWVRISGVVRGPYTPEEIEDLPGFVPMWIVCPEGEDEKRRKNWQFAKTFDDFKVQEEGDVSVETALLKKKTKKNPLSIEEDVVASVDIAVTPIEEAAASVEMKEIRAQTSDINEAIARAREEAPVGTARGAGVWKWLFIAGVLFWGIAKREEMNAPPTVLDIEEKIVGWEGAMDFPIPSCRNTLGGLFEGDEPTIEILEEGKFRLTFISDKISEAEFIYDPEKNQINAVNDSAAKLMDFREKCP